LQRIVPHYQRLYDLALKAVSVLASFSRRLARKNRTQRMAETTINVLNALQGQQAQLKRLIVQKMWISDAPQAMLTEIDAQITQIKALLAELERDIQDRMKGN
jgi:ABC-type transporter Mla subunit MlaD